MDTLPVDLNYVLQQCNAGRVPEELKTLYNMPYRNMVPWSLFPNWARPDQETEGCHEG
jgi:hypothetical protein